MDPWYHINNIEAIDSPCLVVYPERVKQNIATAIRMTDGPERLRPHIKTHKTKEVTELLQAAGVNQFKCATIAEAELLGMSKAKDVLLAYQSIGPKLKRFLQLVNAYPGTQYSCLVDNIPAADEMSAAAAKENIVLSVYIDLNVGMNRTGIAPGPAAMALAQHIKKLPSLTMKGLHAYDGHLRNPNLEERTRECNAAYTRVEAMQQQLGGLWYETVDIIAGGSPSFPIHAARKPLVTPDSSLLTPSCSPGTFVYWDAGYMQSFPEQEFFPAALVIARVVSLPATNKICIDLGHKSVAAENTIENRIRFLNAPELKAISQSEEHLVMEAQEGHGYQPGDVLYGLPVHICPTCALYERALTIEDGNVNGEWKIAARDRKIIH